MAKGFTKPSAKGWARSLLARAAPPPAGRAGAPGGNGQPRPDAGPVEDRGALLACSCVIACEVVDHPSNVLKVGQGSHQVS